MQISTKLQDSYSYSLLLVCIAVAVVLLPIIIGLIVFIVKKAKQPRPIKPKKVKPEELSVIKLRYLNKLAILETAQMAARQKYLELSSLVRNFVYEATGINVHKYTLEEIKATGMQGLTILIEECYKPEFSPEGEGDAVSSVKKAREVIEQWN